MIALLDKFHIEYPSYIIVRQILISIECLIAISVLVFSTLLLKKKNTGRIGLIVSLVVIIIYNLIAPWAPDDIKVHPRTIIPDDSTVDMMFAITYAFYIAVSIGAGILIRYLSKKEIKNSLV